MGGRQTGRRWGQRRAPPRKSRARLRPTTCSGSCGRGHPSRGDIASRDHDGVPRDAPCRADRGGPGMGRNREGRPGGAHRRCCRCLRRARWHAHPVRAGRSDGSGRRGRRGHGTSRGHYVCARPGVRGTDRGDANSRVQSRDATFDARSDGDSTLRKAGVRLADARRAPGRPHAAIARRARDLSGDRGDAPHRLHVRDGLPRWPARQRSLRPPNAGGIRHISPRTRPQRRLAPCRISRSRSLGCIRCGSCRGRVLPLEHTRRRSGNVRSHVGDVGGLGNRRGHGLGRMASAFEPARSGRLDERVCRRRVCGADRCPCAAADRGRRNGCRSGRRHPRS